MKVELIKPITEEDWMLCKMIALKTVGLDAKNPPDKEWKRKILAARHSPIRTLNFCFKITDVPSWVATHLVRHVHAIPFVKTQRNDRQSNYDRNAARQDTPVDMYWYMNAEEFMIVCNKRLCFLAAKETRDVIIEMVNEVMKTNPEFAEFMVPMCYYRGGTCTEFNSCGYNETFFKSEDLRFKVVDFNEDVEEM